MDRRLTSERERSRSSLHLVASIDVVFEQHWDSVQRSQNDSFSAQLVGGLGHSQRVRVELYDRVHPGPILVECNDSVDVVLSQLDRGQLARRHRRLKLRDGELVEVVRW